MLLPPGRRRSALEAAATSMFAEDFGGRILGFGTDAAPPYARIASDRWRAQRPISHFDAQIAAIARSTGAAIATRNLADFDGCGVTLVGCGCATNAEFSRFLSCAYRSLKELATCLELCRRLHRSLQEATVAALVDEANQISRMTYALMQRLGPGGPDTHDS